MKLGQTMSDIFWPRGIACLCCDALIGGGILCPDCQAALAVMRMKPHEQGRVRSAYHYDGLAKQLVIMLKMACAADAAEVLAVAMAEEIHCMKLPADTVITWVTMPKARLRERGIDHGRTLCEAVSRLCGLEVRELLKRRGRFHTQRGLKQEARLRNLNGTVVCNERIDVPVLLIDDVTTTGATASVCAEALLAAGAPRVEVLTATRAMHISQEKENRKADLYGFYTF
nr:ComF family protein [Clostridia bacterium]